jgi:uncharacterized membrane protein
MHLPDDNYSNNFPKETKQMDIERKSDNVLKVETRIIKWQYIMVFTAVLLLLLTWIISKQEFHTYKYAVLITNIPILFISISSITNRVSIIRLKGQKGYQKGTQAVIYGIILIIIEIAWVTYFFLNPSFMIT